MATRLLRTPGFRRINPEIPGNTDHHYLHTCSPSCPDSPNEPQADSVQRAQRNTVPSGTLCPAEHCAQRAVRRRVRRHLIGWPRRHPKEENYCRAFVLRLPASLTTHGRRSPRRRHRDGLVGALLARSCMPPSGRAGARAVLPRRFRSSAPWRAPAVRVGLPSTPGPSQDRLIHRRADDAEVRWGGHGEARRSSASGDGHVYIGGDGQQRTEPP